jgi:hypothetical protein
MLLDRLHCWFRGIDPLAHWKRELACRSSAIPHPLYSPLSSDRSPVLTESISLTEDTAGSFTTKASEQSTGMLEGLFSMMVSAKRHRVVRSQQRSSE